MNNQDEVRDTVDNNFDTFKKTLETKINDIKQKINDIEQKINDIESLNQQLNLSNKLVQQIKKLITEIKNKNDYVYKYYLIYTDKEINTIYPNRKKKDIIIYVGKQIERIHNELNIIEKISQIQNTSTNHDIQNTIKTIMSEYNENQKGEFKANQEALANRGIKIDDFEDIAEVSTKTVGKINNYTPGEIEEANELRLFPIFVYMLWYNIKKTVLSFFDTIIYQLNILYANEFSYYEFFLIVIFMTLILVVGIILYWDHVYRTAKKLSRCSKINMIAYQNRDKDKYPFVYVIMIINESNLDAVLDKYVLKLEYNFVKKTTNAILGETEYVNEVLLSDTSSSYDVDNRNINTKKGDYDKAFTAYDTANIAYPYSIIELKICEDNFAVNCKDFKKSDGNSCPYNDNCATTCENYDEGCKRQITQRANYDAKLRAQKALQEAEGALNGAKNLLSAELAKSQFTYFDLGRMQSKKLESINKTLITDRKYKYICMTPDNKILKTEIARELATFVRDFGMNDKTDIYHLHSVLTAVEKSKEVNV
jgi:hypothetical protein